MELVYENLRFRLMRVFDEQRNSHVLQKTLKAQHVNAEELARFNREYELTALCEGDGVISVYGQTTVNESPAYILEDIGGDSLASLLQSRKLTTPEFLRVALIIADGIANIHRCDVIHKDINPSNIIWNRKTNAVRIIDFGIATVLPREVASASNPKNLEGTIAYISPEQTGRMNRAVDYRSDFYSVGATFYHMLTGRLPFTTRDVLELVHSHIALMPPAPHEIDSSIPYTLSQIVMKLIAKNAEDRYQSALGLKADLEHCVNDWRESNRISDFELATKDASDKFHIPDKLYGRQHEVEQLLTAFERIRIGKLELILIVGSAGIGKSRLIAEIHKPITKHRGHFVSGKFERTKRDVPFSALIQSFNVLARQILAAGDAVVATKKKQILAEVGQLGKLITDFAPAFELVLGPQPDVPQLAPAESQNRFNVVLLRFVQALASADCPLVLFLDDLQWADMASLSLLKLLTTAPDMHHVLLLGAYRDNETPTTHPLTVVLGEIEKSGRTTTTLTLKTLTAAHLCELLHDTFTDKYNVMPLAELLLSKTQGNPFFVNAFLRFLYVEKLFRFNFTDGWSWDLASIAQARATDNVVEFMANKVRELPPENQRVLQIAACVGNRFSVKTLEAVSETSSAEILSILRTAAHDGMIEVSDNVYRFAHDRVHEAFYAICSTDDKARYHYKIGRIEMTAATKKTRAERIFFIVNQLNGGIAHVSQASEKKQLKKLNFEAGSRAIASGAYSSALEYFQTAIRLSESDCWQSNYPFTLALYHGAVAAAQNAANYETMNALAALVLENALHLRDTVPIYEARIFAYIAQDRLIEAVRVGLKILKRFGIHMPEKPSPARVLYAIARTRISLGRRPVESLVTLPEMEDADMRGVIRLLGAISTPAYIAASDLLPLITLKSVTISIKHGNNREIAYNYAGLGMIFSGFFGRFEYGLRWGKLAMAVMEKYGVIGNKSGVLVIFWYFINHWKRNLRESVSPLLEAHNAAIQSGNLEFAAMCLAIHGGAQFFSGVELSETERDMERHMKLIEGFNQRTHLFYQQLMHQAVLNLRGESEDPCRLIGKSFDEEKMVPLYVEQNDTSGLSLIAAHWLLFDCLFDNYDNALTHIEQAERYSKQVIGHPVLPVINMLSSLAYIALTERTTQKHLIKKARRNQKKLKGWAHHAPMNYAHKYHLVEAELARVSGKKLRATEQYKLAISLAHENEFLNDEAIALERYANFCFDIGDTEQSSMFISRAYGVYRQWGALAKVSQMKQRYRRLLENSAMSGVGNKTDITLLTNTVGVSERIDLSTVIKAAQTFSSETNLSQLLQAIMKYALKNAGAERGFLLSENETSGELFIEVQATASGETIFCHSPLEEQTDNLCASAVQYVRKSGDNVVLHDACNEGDFSDDDYINANRVRSLLCALITHKGKRAGMLYLENNLTAHCFTNDRLELLNVLSTQAAISIENARLLIHREHAAKLEKEMEIAANIQAALLPRTPRLDGMEITTHIKPTDAVGGDYYDIINVENRDWVIIGDVSGHGVHAGLLMMMVQTCIHNTLQLHPDLCPAKLLNIVNKTITENIILMGEDRYMTIMALVSYRDGRFSFAGLHQDILIYRKQQNKVEVIDTEGIWIGLFDDLSSALRDSSIELASEDVMLLYTDGITEAWQNDDEGGRRGKSEMFGDVRLQQTFQKYAPTSSVEAIRDGILRALDVYISDDDVTMVIIRKP